MPYLVYPIAKHKYAQVSQIQPSKYNLLAKSEVMKDHQENVEIVEYSYHLLHSIIQWYSQTPFLQPEIVH